MPTTPHTPENISFDLMDWADDSAAPTPKCFGTWSFAADELVRLRAFCEHEPTAEFLALALQHLTEEADVIELTEQFDRCCA